MEGNGQSDLLALRSAVKRGHVGGAPLEEGSKILSPVQELREWKDAVGVVLVLVITC
jgi:hypothetical protein